MIQRAWVSKREKETSLSGSENKLYQGKYISEKDTTERSNNIQRTSVIDQSERHCKIIIQNMLWK